MSTVSQINKFAKAQKAMATRKYDGEQDSTAQKVFSRSMQKSHMDPATLLSVTGLVDLAQRFAWAFRSSDHHKTMHMADTPFFVSGEQYHTATASFISSYCSFPSPSLSAYFFPTVFLTFGQFLADFERHVLGCIDAKV